MKWIDEIILGLIDTYSTTDIYELCDSLGIQITKLDKDSIILSGKNAIYDRNDNGTEKIFIRNDLQKEIEEFILKHELGHAILHPELLSHFYAFTNIRKMDRHANYFALKLSNLYIDEIEMKNMTLEQIASCVNIPYEVMEQLVNF